MSSRSLTTPCLHDEAEAIFNAYLQANSTADAVLGELTLFDRISIRSEFDRHLEEVDADCMQKYPGQHGVKTIHRLIELLVNLQTIKSKLRSHQNEKFKDLREAYSQAVSNTTSIASFHTAVPIPIREKEFQIQIQTLEANQKSKDQIQLMSQAELCTRNVWESEHKNIHEFIIQTNKLFAKMAKLIEHKEKVIGDRSRERTSRYGLIVAIFALLIANYNNLKVGSSQFLADILYLFDILF